jgi:hypothetical protein
MGRSVLITDAKGGLTAPSPPKLVNSLIAVYLTYGIYAVLDISGTHNILSIIVYTPHYYYEPLSIGLSSLTAFALLPLRQSEFEARKCHQ